MSKQIVIRNTRVPTAHIQSYSAKQVCKCDMFQLMNNGCKCGGV